MIQYDSANAITEFRSIGIGLSDVGIDKHKLVLWNLELLDGGLQRRPALRVKAETKALRKVLPNIFC